MAGQKVLDVLLSCGDDDVFPGLVCKTCETLLYACNRNMLEDPIPEGVMLDDDPSMNIMVILLEHAKLSPKCCRAIEETAMRDGALGIGFRKLAPSRARVGGRCDAGLK